MGQVLGHGVFLYDQGPSALVSWSVFRWGEAQWDLLDGFVGYGSVVVDENFRINVVNEGKLADLVNKLHTRLLWSVYYIVISAVVHWVLLVCWCPATSTKKLVWMYWIESEPLLRKYVHAHRWVVPKACLILRAGLLLHRIECLLVGFRDKCLLSISWTVRRWTSTFFVALVDDFGDDVFNASLFHELWRGSQ